jgi:hypothetical protein
MYDCSLSDLNPIGSVSVSQKLTEVEAAPSNTELKFRF